MQKKWAHAKRMHVEKTGDRAQSAREHMRTLREGKYKRLFKIQSVPEIYAKYILQNSWYRASDASWFARQFTNCINRPHRAFLFHGNFYSRGISRTTCCAWLCVLFHSRAKAGYGQSERRARAPEKNVQLARLERLRLSRCKRKEKRNGISTFKLSREL